MRTRRLLVPAATVSALMLVACGGSDDTSADTDSEAPETSQTEAESEDDTTEDDSDAVVSEDGISNGVATITFADGSTLTTEVVCTLEPQEAAGQEILYTATALTSPYFDITVFGESSDFAGAVVTWDETEDFETIEESWSAGDLSGSEFEASLDGTTITGSGTFVRGDDATGNPGEEREGEVEVVCGQ